MEIEKMTKAELLAKVAELEAKITETVHLASAIEYKDKEILLLKKDIERIKNEHLSSFNRVNEESKREKNEHLSSFNRVNEESKREIEKLKQELLSLKVPQPESKKVEELEKNVKILSEENQRLVGIANQYISVFRNLLKSLQGQVDIAIELEGLINPTVKK
jgi:hypothetical protein